MKLKKGIYEKYIKRPMDCILSLIALLILSPVMLVVAILVKVKLGSPIIFQQRRPGFNEEIFNLYKFKTMTDKMDEDGKLLPDCERLTSFGKILRSTSLDELPELWNIIKGDMSIVGPRPLAVQYLPYYTKEERKRHKVRPGLSGLAQINGRTVLSWEQRFIFDIEYVNNITLINDFKIIIRTVIKVFKRADIIEAGQQGDFNIYREKQWNEGGISRNY